MPPVYLIYEELKKQGKIKNKRDFAEQFGLDMGNYSRYLSGQFKLTLDANIYQRFLNAGINIEFLLTGRGNMFQSPEKCISLQFSKPDQDDTPCLFFWSNYKDDTIFSKCLAELKSRIDCVFYVFCETNYENSEALSKHEEQIKKLCDNLKLDSLIIPKEEFPKESFCNTNLIKKEIKKIFSQIKEKIPAPTKVYIALADDGFESPLSDKILLNEGLNYTLVGMYSLSNYFTALFGRDTVSLQVIPRKQEIVGF